MAPALLRMSPDEVAGLPLELTVMSKTEGTPMLQRTALSLLLLGLTSAPAGAQPVPDEGTVTLGAEGGLLAPRDEFDPTVSVGVLFDYYLTPRFGLRPTFGWAEPGLDDTDTSLRHVRLTIDGLYNWEGGKWHPFLGAGFGAYFFQLKHDGRSVGDGETEPGVNVTGGIEYFWSLTTLKREASYHFVNQGALPFSPSVFVATVGIKRYFL